MGHESAITGGNHFAEACAMESKMLPAHGVGRSDDLFKNAAAGNRGL